MIAGWHQGADRTAADAQTHSCNRPASLLLLELFFILDLQLHFGAQLIVVALGVCELRLARKIYRVLVVLTLLCRKLVAKVLTDVVKDAVVMNVHD